MTAVPTTMVGLVSTLRFDLRRERLRLPLAVLGIAGLLLLMAGSLVRLYPDAESRAGAALTLDNPGSTFLVGRIYRADDYDWGVMIGHETLVVLAVAVALISVASVVRHTRAEEEKGRTELLRAGSVGRHAPLLSAVLVALLLNVAVGAAVALTLTGVGEEAVDLSGTLVFAASITSVGLVFSGVAAVTAQLFSTARAASGTAAMVLAASFLVRGVADVSDDASWLTWLSPFGWAQQTFPWHRDRWWPLLIPVVSTLLLLALAWALSARRDLGAALRPARPGPQAATGVLRSPFGLALRLNRAVVVGWVSGLAVFAAVYGPVLGEAEEFLTQMPVLSEFLPEASGAGGVRLFAAILVGLGALVATVPATQVLTRLCGDEQARRTAPLLAGSMSRLQWYVANVVLSLVTATLAILALCLVLGSAARLVTAEDALLGDIVEGGMGRLAAVAVVLGVAALFAGWAPRWVGLVWGLLAFCFVTLYFAELMDWPTWVRSLSPFDHLVARPAQGGGDGQTQLLQWGLALALFVLGGVGYRTRGIEG